MDSNLGSAWMQSRLKAKIIAGFGRMPPSIICGCRWWPSAQAQSEISKPNPYRARNRKFESISLLRRVRLSTGISLARSRSCAFRANVRAMPGDGVGRDRYGPGDIAPLATNVSAGPNFSTAGPAMDRS